MANRRERLTAIYTGCAVVWLNTTLLLIALNIVLGLFIWRGERARAPRTPLEKYGIRDIAKAYPGRPPEEVRALLAETWETPSPLQFDSETVFRPRARSGRFINIHPAGFRIGKNQGPWPPDSTALNIFVFGGSTAFGMGVGDDETIPSRLQEFLESAHLPDRMRVYNFSVSGFFSTQERALFEKLIVAGHPPDIAIFIDGLNDFYLWDGEPIFADRFSMIMAGAGDPAQHSAIPMLRAAESLRARLPNHARLPGEAKPHPPFDDAATNTAVCDRWLANRRIIQAVATASGVHPLSVWQPVPGYKYDLRYHALAQGDPKFLQENLRSRYGYAIMDRMLGTGKSAPDMLWLADMQQDRKENLYVDHWHYTAAFSRDIAEKIAGHLLRFSLLRKRPLAGKHGGKE